MLIGLHAYIMANMYFIHGQNIYIRQGAEYLLLMYSSTFFTRTHITYGSCTRTHTRSHTQCTQILRVHYEYI